MRTPTLAFLALLLAAAGVWLVSHGSPRPVSTTASGPAPRTLRLGLVPEKDIFQQRKAYQALGEYVEGKMGLHVELVTAASYAGVLRDFEEKKIDAAFMGSLVAVLAIDRYQAEVMLKSEGDTGLSTYSGVIFVLDSSPAHTLADLGRKRVGAIRTTLGGAVYPIYLMHKLGVTDASFGGDGPQLVWSGTHDDVIREVVAGNLDGGAVKDLRLLAYQREHPEVRLRVLSESERVPDNALLVARDYPAEMRGGLVQTLGAMDHDPAAAPALAALKIRRYLACNVRDYARLYELIDQLGPAWEELTIGGPAPKFPGGQGETSPATVPAKGGS